MQGFVAAGVGVSLIAELGLTSVRDDIVVRSLGRETPVREVYAATAADAHRTPATHAMLEILAGVATRYESRRPQLQLVGLGRRRAQREGQRPASRRPSAARRWRSIALA